MYCEHVCGYFACEGYHLDTTFFPREIAFLTASTINVYGVNVGIKTKDLSYRMTSTVIKDVESHGIPLETNEGISLDKICTLINKFYDANRDDDRFLIACSTEDTAVMLKNLGIPTYEIVVRGVETRKPCSLHKLKNSDSKCALVTVLDIEQWKRQEEEDNIWFAKPYDTCDPYFNPESRRRQPSYLSIFNCAYCNNKHAFDV